MAVQSKLDLINGAEFFDQASNQEMLIKNWSDGHPWLFFDIPSIEGFSVHTEA